jgi:AraC family transcriptional regulator, transcriptional activator of pobA
VHVPHLLCGMFVGQGGSEHGKRLFAERGVVFPELVPPPPVRRRTTVPVFTYVTEPGVPPVFVMRLNQEALRRVEARAHTNDFPGLIYFERSAGALTFRGRETLIHAGDVYLIGPNAVVDVVGDPEGLVHARGSAVFFTPDAFEAFGAVGSELAWRMHRLLRVFARDNADVVHLIHIPPGERRAWHDGIAGIECELHERREGYREAVVAQLVLLLVSATRLAAGQGDELQGGATGLLDEVFAVIEQRFGGPLSLSDVAEAVHLSPGHLTTALRRRTGRTVQDWIVERRMTEARRLLVETDLGVAEVGRRVGYPDPTYFSRVFGRAHEQTPGEGAWRRASAPGSG